MDVFPEHKRRELMARVRNKNTRPERAFRSALHRRGFRFRLHPKNLPGTPDIVLPKYRTAVFIHGCFWHGHDCGRGRLPATNRSFWEDKIRRNRERDAAAQAALAQLGWKVVVVWTCGISSRAGLEAEADAVVGELRRGAEAAAEKSPEYPASMN